MPFNTRPAQMLRVYNSKNKCITNIYLTDTFTQKVFGKPNSGVLTEENIATLFECIRTEHFVSYTTHKYNKHCK
jgi:hypothetical protein